MPNGQFGTRIMGGHDAASPRYIHTELNKIVTLLYPTSDFPLLDYNDDDGVLVEPKQYVPIIPMVLVNGMTGIGTGFSTSIPCYAIKDVIENVKRRLSGRPYKKTIPSSHGFKGQTVQIDQKNYLSKGKYEIVSPTRLRITELPLGKWTDDYKKFLDSLLPETNESKSKKKETKKKKEKKTILDYTNNCSDTEIDFTIHLPVGMINSLQWSEDPNIDGIEKFFKLTTTKGLSLTNMHLYNNKGQIVKYNSLNDIYDEFYEERYALYVKRKKYILSNLSNDLLILESKVRFINDVINEQIIIYKQKKDIILQTLIDKKYLQVKDKMVLSEQAKYLPSNYDYLVKMSLYAFTEEEITKLETEMKKLQEQYSELDQKTIEEIWSSECDCLKKAL